SRFAPRCTGTRTSDTGLAFTTTMRMVVGVHNRTADSRADTHVTFPSCFTDVNQVVVAVADHTNSRTAGNRNHSHLAGGKTKSRIFALFCHQLRAHTSRTNH